MRIQHNIAALNSHRQLTNNNSSVSKNLEKLSSGYRINRAGDDAAGLAISEKMRAQITGLNTASKNAQDGISLVQTAEGALTEVHSMLNRMTELAGQSANGTYRNEVDRENVQEELNSLRSEIDRISDSTNFNGITLLNGNLSTKGVAGKPVETTVNFTGPKGVGTDDVAAIAGTFEMGANIADKDAMALGDKISYTFEYMDKNGVAQSTTIELTMSELSTDKTKFSLKDANGTEYTLAANTAANAKIADIQGALKTALTNDKNFSDNFTVATKGANNFTFTAKDKGTSGASLTGIKSSSTVAATGAITPINNSAVKATIAKDAYESVDLSNLETFKGTNASKSIFELNGKKFAFIDSTLAGDDLTKALDALKEAGVEHFVQTAGANTIATGDMAAMIEKINYETGLDVKQGAFAGGVFTAGNGTSISLTARETARTEKAKTTGGLSLQIGESSDDFNQLTVSIESMSTSSLGIDKLSLATQDDAKGAVKLIKDAINTVSSTRGKLGAIQNRLEHTINNLGVTAENMTAAESRIRDVDMAQEMMNFTKNNILTQASQAMLAQANQLPQGVLQLLQ